jgi:hypothetical protein
MINVSLWISAGHAPRMATPGTRVPPIRILKQRLELSQAFAKPLRENLLRRMCTGPGASAMLGCVARV